MSERTKTILWTAAALLTGAIILGWFVAKYSDGVLAFDLANSSDGRQAFWTRFYYIAAVSILVERSVEVYLKLTQQDGITKTDATGQRIKVTDASRTAAIASLTICVLLAFVGLRLLESLLQPVMQTAADAGNGENGAETHPWVMSVFFGVDVIISAGLMAGGAAIFHPLAKAITQLFEGLQIPGSRTTGTNWVSESASRPAAVAEPTPAFADHFEDHAILRALSIDDLKLKEPALAGAKKLLATHSDVVFTSGTRDVAGQASAMAGNVVLNRKWIEQTYVATAERTELQGWVDANPNKKTKAEIAAGLEGIMINWTDAQKKNISRHMIGLAFDLKPMSGENGAKVMATIENLPEKHKFLTKEGGLVIWHVQFNMP